MQYSMAIQCKSSMVDLCRYNDFKVNLEYDRLVASSKYGVDVIRETRHQRFDDDDAFEVQFHIQKVTVTEYDSSNKMLPPVVNYTIDDQTHLNIASWADDTLITTLGRIWINVDNLALEIEYSRERWIDHLALVAAFNLFWVMVFHCILQFFVKMHMKDSLRRELAPDLAKEGDFLAKKSTCGNLRRSLCPSGPFSFMTQAEK
jgi:hypothetical protein